LKTIATTSSLAESNVLAMRQGVELRELRSMCEFKDAILVSWHLVDTEDNHFRCGLSTAKISELAFQRFQKKTRDPAKGNIRPNQ
jgi:hypothetical protein